jgi:D-3-phosphoglycerate dehydrogenase
LAARKIWQGINWAQTLQGQEDVAGLVEKGKANFGGSEILGKTIGILGIGGAIGLLTANACAALGMKVVGSDPFLSDAARQKLAPGIIAHKTDDPSEYIGECDYLSVHVPYNANTKHMLDGALLAKCKRGAVLVNAARAELVEDAAMKAALAAGQIGVYVTDFPNGELLGVDNVITIPHLGASSEEAEENCAFMAAVQTRDYLETGNIVNSVNFPAVALDVDAPLRSSILFKDDGEGKVFEKIHAVVAERNTGFQFAKSARNGLGLGSALFAYENDTCNGACDIIKAMPEVILARRIKK